VPTTETNAASGGWVGFRPGTPSFSFPADRLLITSPAEQKQPSHAHGQPPPRDLSAFVFLRFSLSSSPRRPLCPAHLARPLGLTIEKTRRFAEVSCILFVSPRSTRSFPVQLYGRGDGWKYSLTRQVTKQTWVYGQRFVSPAGTSAVAFCTLFSS
jgi:hypothetical protein